ncbi:MAG: SH3 domain-containing protein [Ruminococcus sp.]|nr:SH3 domain-containing protein [Ruminococcus sp.]
MKKIIASLFTAALLGGAANAAAAYAAETTPAGIDNLSLTEQNVSASSEGQLYTTKDVESELRLRAEATTEAEIVGNIPVGALFSVTDISGDWAEAEYGSSKGYVSVKYIRKITDADSGITIKDAASPEWFIPVNAGWDFKGSVSSKLVLKRVWGGVYKRDGKTEVLTASTSPESDQFDTAGFLNKNVDISKVGKGNYTYKLFAEDAAGKVAELVSSDFTKLGDAADYPSENPGDLNKDGKFTSADADMLQRYLIGDQKLNTAQFIASDMDHDMQVNAFDLVLLRQNILASPDAPSVDPTDGWSTDQAGTYTTKNVNTELNIRKSASISDGTVGSIPAGAKFTVSRTSKDWAYAEYNGMKGYVSVAYIQKYTEPQKDPEIIWSTADAGIYVKKNLTGDINVRESASNDSKVIGAIPGGAKFRVTKTSKDWVYVDYKDLQGYVPMANVQKYVEPVVDPGNGWSTADAGTYTTKNVQNYLNIRESDNVSAKVLGTIPANAKFTVTKTSSGWAYAEYNNVKGYVSKDYIQKYTEPEIVWSTADAGIYVKKNLTGDINVRESASADSKILGAIPGGAKFRVTKTSKDWVYVDYKDLQGYVPMANVQKYVEPVVDPGNGWSTADAGTYTTKNVQNYLNIRESDNVSAKVLGTIPANAKFTVTKTSSSWAYAEYNGVKGCVSKAYIQKYTEPAIVWSTADAGTYITNGVNDDLNIREAASTASKIIGSIPANAKFTVTKTSKDWAYAEYNSVKGYVSTEFIKKYTEPEIVWSTADAGIYVKKNLNGDINVRESANANSKVIGAIPGGAKFRVTKTSKDWVYVDYKDLQGYVPMANVQKYVELEEGWTAITAGTYTTYNVTDGLNFRAAANINSEIIGTIPAGATFNVIKTSKDWAYAEYIGTKGYVSTSYIKMIDSSNDVSVHLNVMEYNQNPSYPTGCESAALYMLLKYYDVNVTMEQIVQALPKGPLPYYSSGTLYGANPETEFVGDPHSSYSYGVFNEPLAKTAAKFKSGVKTKKDSSIDEIIALLKTGKPVVAWYTTTPGKDIYYNDSWYDYKTGKLIRWPAGEHAVVVCGFNIASRTLTYRDPNTGGSRTVSFGTFEGVFKELGSRILYY